jgi:hypothetical protein
VNERWVKKPAWKYDSGTPLAHGNKWARRKSFVVWFFENRITREHRFDTEAVRFLLSFMPAVVSITVLHKQDC